MPSAFVETRDAEVRRSVQAEDHGMSFPPWNQQMEQGGASFVFIHQHELEGPPADGLRDGGQPDSCHDDPNWIDRHGAIGHENISAWNQGERQRTKKSQDPAARIPRRMELQHRAKGVIVSKLLFHRC